MAAQDTGDVDVPDQSNGESLLAQLARGRSDVVNANRDALGDGWHVAEAFVMLHADILRRLSRKLGQDWTEAEQGVLLLGTHSLNVFVAVIGAACRGDFDTVQYFTRAVLDASSLLVVCAVSEEHARRWRRGELRASQARKDFVQALRDGGESTLADEIDYQMREDSDAANEASHMGLVHADKMIHRDDTGSLTPIIGGRIDANLAVNQVEMAVAVEMSVVNALTGVFFSEPDTHEQDVLATLHDQLSLWRAGLAAS